MFCAVECFQLQRKAVAWTQVSFVIRRDFLVSGVRETGNVSGFFALRSSPSARGREILEVFFGPLRCSLQGLKIRRDILAASVLQEVGRSVVIFLVSDVFREVGRSVGIFLVSSALREVGRSVGIFLVLWVSRDVWRVESQLF